MAEGMSGSSKALSRGSRNVDRDEGGRAQMAALGPNKEVKLPGWIL